MGDPQSRRSITRPAWRWLLAKYFLRLGDREIEAELEETPQGPRVNIDGNWYAVGLQRIGETSRYILTLNDRVLEVLVSEEQAGFNLQIGGRTYDVETTRRRGPRRQEQAESFVDGVWTLISPLTGVVNEMRVEVGNHVQQGDVIAVIEAMKMLNDLRSRVSGVVTTVHVQEKDRVEIGQRLIEISEHQPAP